MSTARERMLSLGNTGNLIPEAKQQTFTVTNPLADDRTFNEGVPVLLDTTRALATLIRDLEIAGHLKYTTS